MGAANKKRRNNRNNKKNKIKKANKLQTTNVSSEELDKQESDMISQEVLATPQKRFYDNDSDDEQQPKKKKKKQHMITESTDANKGQKKKSIRQMKREKYLERIAAAEAANKEQLKEQCLNYLSQWKHDQSNWKFMKAKQIWLNKNKFSRTLVPDESWPLLLEYLQSSKGNIRNVLLDDANKVIKQMEEWTESQEKNDDNIANTDEVTEVNKPDDVIYKRARDLIQCLQE
ncbi:uncharacterized protein C7orf50 homolog [Galleria mellonella]|uniref:Uncharacterized protein C7orf50 homolog n=1 Tax=Galleria mellonella TaxID=7137 RepID=A0A6J1X0G2_GALME|nr:uncharacterized protein C7orf50 homolog [Galleria mellonella]